MPDLGFLNGELCLESYISFLNGELCLESYIKINVEEQDGGGVGGCGVHLSPLIHQEYTFRHRSSCRTPANTGHEYHTTRKEYK